MTDPVSPEGLREHVLSVDSAMTIGCSCGFDDNDYEVMTRHIWDAALRDTGPRPDSGIEVLLDGLPPASCYRAHCDVTDEHKGVFGAVWKADVVRSCSTPRTETSDPTRAQVEQAFIDGSVEGSPIDHDGTPRTETPDHD